MKICAFYNVSTRDGQNLEKNYNIRIYELNAINRNQSYRTSSTFLPKTSRYNCSRSTVISRPTESVAAPRPIGAGEDLVENGVVVAFMGILARIAAFFVVPEMVVERRLGVWSCGIPFAEELIAHLWVETDQIKEKKYIASLEPYIGDILLVGINYDKKRPKAINEQISNFAQTYPTNLKASSNEALLFMRRYRFANCSCFSCCFKDAYPSSNVQ